MRQNTGPADFPRQDDVTVSFNGAESELLVTYPNLGMTAAELLEEEQLLDLGDDTATYTEIVTRVLAS